MEETVGKSKSCVEKKERGEDRKKFTLKVGPPHFMTLLHELFLIKRYFFKVSSSAYQAVQCSAEHVVHYRATCTVQSKNCSREQAVRCRAIGTLKSQHYSA